MNNSYTYTKASRFLALFVFLIVIPVLAFTVGVQYEKTSQVLSGQDIIATSPVTATGTMMHGGTTGTTPVSIVTTTNSTTTVTNASTTASSTNPRPNDKVLVR